MKKPSFARFFRVLAILLVVALGVALMIPTSRAVLAGLVHQERFEDGMPASHWIKTLEDPNPEMRVQAAQNLCRISPEVDGAVPALAKALKDPDSLIRARVALALMKLGEKSKPALPALIEALRDEEPNVRMYASQTIGKIGPDAKSAVPALIEVINDSRNWDDLGYFFKSIRQQSIVTLGKIGPEAKEAVPAIVTTLDDTMLRDFREEIIEALKRIDPETAAKQSVVRQPKKKAMKAEKP